MSIGEQDSASGQLIDIRRLHDPSITIQAPDPIAHVIDRQEKDIRALN
jgi:hypothetical protein